jgi:formylglycine-generating enzyme required for sulfatase activity
MATSPRHRSGCDSCPVTHVSWYQAVTYCNALSQRRQLPACYTVNGLSVVWPGPSCQGYRLPTEAEWEYAARAGSDAPQYGPVDEVAWYDENAQLKVHTVGGKRPNAFGLYDMLGNVAEWVWDWQAEYPRRTVRDPIGPGSGENRLFRGGSWRYGDGESTAGFRSAYGPLNQVEFIGFRCVRSLGGAP